MERRNGMFLGLRKVEELKSPFFDNFSITLSTSKKESYLYDSDGNLLLIEVLAQNPDLLPSALLDRVSFSLRSSYDKPIVAEGRLTDTVCA